ncbi:MAG: N-acetylmuramoyl-L-alanine amidase [Clostridiales bacterium]|jgi:N-acetylmuramoyl-L-alanine amidase|nr:N-acetylmuramoyl-L-alanine amidase [Clostridiales bacterium]
MFCLRLFSVLLTAACLLTVAWAGGGEAYAAAADSGAQRIKSVRHAAVGGVQTITINAEQYGNVKTETLTGPDRFVIDIGGVTAPGRQQTLSVNIGNVLAVRYVQYDTTTVRVVVDLSAPVLFELKAGKGFIKFEAKTGVKDSGPVISLPVYETAGAAAGAPESTATDSAPTGAPAGSAALTPTATSTAPPTAPPVATPATAPASPATETPQATLTPTRVPRYPAVETTKADQTPDAEQTPRPVRTPRPERSPRKPTSSASPSPQRRASPRRSPTPAATASSEPGLSIPPPIVTKDEYLFTVATGFYVRFSTKGGENTVTIDASALGKAKITVAEQDGPAQIVADVQAVLPGLISGARTFTVNADVLKSVRITQPERNIVHLTFALNGQTDCDITQPQEGKAVIRLTNRFLKNVVYHKDGERAFLTLYQTALTAGGEELEEFYLASYQNGGKSCELSFDSSLDALAAGRAAVDDDLLRSVEVVREGGKTRLVIAAKAAIRCSVFTKNIPSANLLETTVSILRPAAAGESVVVIDAGHGGHDSGAVGLSGKYEKDFCLDIAIKLRDTLRQEPGVRVFLTRDDDYFVDLYERARIANDLNATLFVSIHANATDDNPEARGTETLYNPSAAGGAFTSKQFAELAQKNLIAKLKTFDRSVKERPNLVVLRKTRMPAILVETAFVTNEADLANLSRSPFRRNAAAAVAASIGQALDLLAH